MIDTTIPRHQTCDSLPEFTAEMRAKTIVGIMRRQFGEIYIFAHAPAELAEACEVRPEIADWMATMSRHSEAIALHWSRTKPIIDARSAARAIEEAGI